MYLKNWNNYLITYININNYFFSSSAIIFRMKQVATTIINYKIYN